MFAIIIIYVYSYKADKGGGMVASQQDASGSIDR